LWTKQDRTEWRLGFRLSLNEPGKDTLRNSVPRDDSADRRGAPADRWRTGIRLFNKENETDLGWMCPLLCHIRPDQGHGSSSARRGQYPRGQPENQAENGQIVHAPERVIVIFTERFEIAGNLFREFIFLVNEIQ